MSSYQVLEVSVIGVAQELVCEVAVDEGDVAAVTVFALSVVERVYNGEMVTQRRGESFNLRHEVDAKV